MKNIYKVFIALILFFGIVFVGWNDCHYYREGYFLHTVFNNYVVFVDDCGYEWEMFTDGQDFKDGQPVKVLMFDNYTHNHINDDKCIDYKFTKNNF